MKREVGLWIDHTRAIIVTMAGDTAETRQVRSNIGKHVRFSGGSQENPLYGTLTISGEGKQDIRFASYLSTYFEGIVSLIRHADSIWIFGPGGAKGELEQHLRRGSPHAQIVSVETVEKMTERQIVEKVRQYFQK